MKALLGLVLLSVFLTSGYSLECELCSAQGTTCSSQKVPCPAGQDDCLIILTEKTVGSEKRSSILKSCTEKNECRKLKVGDPSTIGGHGSIIKSFECNRAPVATGSFFMALSGLLFLKLLG